MDEYLKIGLQNCRLEESYFWKCNGANTRRLEQVLKEKLVFAQDTNGGKKRQNLNIFQLLCNKMTNGGNDVRIWGICSIKLANKRMKEHDADNSLSIKKEQYWILWGNKLCSNSCVHFRWDLIVCSDEVHMKCINKQLVSKPTDYLVG